MLTCRGLAKPMKNIVGVALVTASECRKKHVLMVALKLPIAGRALWAPPQVSIVFGCLLPFSYLFDKIRIILKLARVCNAVRKYGEGRTTHEF